MNIPSWKRTGAIVVATSLLAIVTPTSASAAPVSVSNGVGGTVTINDDHFLPGDRIEFTGSGFTPDATTTSGTGNPVLGVKVNDGDLPAGWTFGGASAVDISDFFDEGVASFEITSGQFTGWLQTPANVAEGTYSFRFLGGSLSTVGLNEGVRLTPQSFAATVTLGASAQVVYQGHSPSANEAQGALKVNLRDFTRADGDGGQKVAFKLDGGGPTVGCVQTDATGNADNVAINLPADIAPGEHTLNILAGSACGEGPQAPSRSIALTFTPATAQVISATNHPGSALTVNLAGFTRADGAGGQRLAFKIDATSGGDQPIIACASTDANGNASNFQVPLPADISLGSHILNILAGSNCGEAGGGNQAPGRGLPVSFTVVERPALSGTSAPTIVGTAQVGKTLRATAGTWNYSGIEVTGYQWFRGVTPIAGATSATYIPSAADVNARLKVTVTAVHTTAGAAHQTSTLTPAVARGTLVNVKRPKITGKPRVGKKLKVTKGTWNPKNAKVTYQWFRGKKAIKKATKTTYKLKKADRKKRVRVVVRATQPGYTTVSVKTKQTVKVKKAKAKSKSSSKAR